jgi:hypothetical protein
MHRRVPWPCRIAPILAALLAVVTLAAEPVKLALYPQKIRTFY